MYRDENYNKEDSNMSNSYNTNESYSTNESYNTNDSYNTNVSNNSTYGYNEYSIYGSSNDNGKKKPKKHKLGLGLAYVAVFGLVVGGSFAGINYFADRNNDSAIISESQSPSDTNSNGDIISSTGAQKQGSDQGGQTILTTNQVADTKITDVSSVVEETMPAIVSINSTAIVSSNYFGQKVEQEQQGSGSGIIIGQNSNELLIVTNNHVVNNATKVMITFSDEAMVEATIKGTDSSNDLAVVSVPLKDITSETKAVIRVATIGSSDDAKVGEMVIAIGNALGYGQSVTVGYLSAKDRTVDTEDYSMNLLQTDAAINPGNSGGALLNSAGQLIGINSVKFADTNVEGMGYAIPISYAVPIINDLMNREEIPEEEQAYLGIYTSEVTQAISEAYNMPVGVYVAKITSGSPAEQYGLKSNDIIIKVDGRDVTTTNALQEILTGKRAGTEMVIVVKRLNGSEYAEKELKVVLGSKPAQSTENGNSNGNGRR